MNFVHVPLTLSRRLLRLLKWPLFWWLTFFVHTVVFASAALFYYIERDHNPVPLTATDAIYWSIATATTVGYGDIRTVTIAGKWLSMGLMLSGTLFSALYTALFASALIEEDLKHLEDDILRRKQ